MAYRAAVSIASNARPHFIRFAQQSRWKHSHNLKLNPRSHTVRVVGSALTAAVVGVVGYTVGTHWTLAVTPRDSPGCQEIQESTAQQDISGDGIHHNRQNKKECSKSYLLEKAIQESTDLAQRIKDEVGSPGLVISVSVDGKEIWSDGLGYADLENRVPCTGDTVLRIASISKSITMAIVGRLWQAGLLDLDKPVTEYVTSFPEKEFNGEKVTITTRQLVSHMGGLRHYDKSCKLPESRADRKKKEKNAEKKKEGSGYDTQIPNKDIKDKRNTTGETTKRGNGDKKDTTKDSEFVLAEYHIRQHYDTVTDALKLFQNDALCFKPGTQFYYTTHGWSLVAAVAEAASGKEFPLLLKELIKDLGLEKTYMDENDSIIYNRARYFVRNGSGRIVNAPYVDCSYKWAGGGLLSTARDLCKFGNVMLYSYQQPVAGEMSAPAAGEPVPPPAAGGPVPAPVAGGQVPAPGYLKKEIVEEMWTVVDKTKCSWDSDGGHGLGWAVIPGVVKNGACREQRFYVSHTGGAIGASSVLLVLPRKPAETQTEAGDKRSRPRGVVVSMIVNLQSVGLNKVALEIAKKFEQLDL